MALTPNFLSHDHRQGEDEPKPWMDVPINIDHGWPTNGQSLWVSTFKADSLVDHETQLKNYRQPASYGIIHIVGKGMPVWCSRQRQPSAAAS